MEMTTLILIVLAWLVAAGSPGPATLAILATSMNLGRPAGLVIASGILAGSASWGVAAALGIGSVMAANAWLFELVRYAGAGYLFYLATKSIRSAVHPTPSAFDNPGTHRLFMKGFALHLTNPKAVLAWGSVFAIALPTGSSPWLVLELFTVLIFASAFIFLGYALLFSNRHVSAVYLRLRRMFDALFGLLFGAAGLKIFTTRIELQ